MGADHNGCGVGVGGQLASPQLLRRLAGHFGVDQARELPCSCPTAEVPALTPATVVRDHARKRGSVEDAAALAEVGVLMQGGVLRLR